MTDSVQRRRVVDEMNEVDQQQPLLQQPTCITCMETLKKDSEELDGITLLVVGTEAKDVYILPQDPGASAFLCKVRLPSVPVSFAVSG